MTQAGNGSQTVATRCMAKQAGAAIDAPWRLPATRDNRRPPSTTSDNRSTSSRCPNLRHRTAGSLRPAGISATGVVGIPFRVELRGAAKVGAVSRWPVRRRPGWRRCRRRGPNPDPKIRKESHPTRETWTDQKGPCKGRVQYLPLSL